MANHRRTGQGDDRGRRGHSPREQPAEGVILPPGAKSSAQRMGHLQRDERFTPQTRPHGSFGPRRLARDSGLPRGQPRRRWAGAGASSAGSLELRGFLCAPDRGRLVNQESTGPGGWSPSGQSVCYKSSSKLQTGSALPRLLRMPRTPMPCIANAGPEPVLVRRD